VLAGFDAANVTREKSDYFSRIGSRYICGIVDGCNVAFPSSLDATNGTHYAERGRLKADVLSPANETRTNDHQSRRARTPLIPSDRAGSERPDPKHSH